MGHASKLVSQRSVPRLGRSLAVSDCFSAEKREWYEPDILSSSITSFRDAELQAIDELAEAASAGLDRSLENSVALACLEAAKAAVAQEYAAYEGDSRARTACRLTCGTRLPLHEQPPHALPRARTRAPARLCFARARARRF